MNLRELFLKEEDEVYIVIVRDNGETIRVPGIPLNALQSENFEERLQALIDKNYPDGDISVGGNWSVVDRDGVDIDIRALNPEPTDDGEIPPADEPASQGETEPELDTTSYEEIPTVTADEMQAEIDAAVDDADVPNIEVEVVPDSNNEPLSIEVTAQDETEEPPSVNGVTVITPDELDQMIDDYADKVDQDGDGINDETGEPVTRSSDLPQVNVPTFGGGLDGDTGDEGTEGEEGAVTGEQREEIPSIIEELHDSIQGPGTNETQMINALKRIQTSAHLEAVVEMYREEYGDSLPQDIIDEFKYDLGGGNAAQVEEINRVMRPLGWEITGTRYIDMRWKKYEGGQD